MNATTEPAPASPAPGTPTPDATARTLPAWVGPLAFAVAVAALFWDTFAKLVDLWERDPNYNHGWLVVPVSLGIAAWQFVKRPAPPGNPDRKLGWVALACAGVCHMLALLVSYLGFDFLALFFVVRGGLMFSGNRAWAARFNFPLAFLVFMFPLPPMWLAWVALRLQDIAAGVSETVLGLFVPVIRHGHNIRMAGMPAELTVAEECSGTRQMVAFVAMAALVGFFTSKNVWYRLLLVLSSVPVAVIANVLRVVLMNAGAYWFGTGWLNGWMHHAPAAFTLPVGFLLFLAIDRTLLGLFGKKATKPTVTPAPATADGVPTPPIPAPPKEKAPPAPPLPSDFSVRWLLAAAVVAGMFGLALLLGWHLVSGGTGQASKPGGWVTTESLMVDRYRESGGKPCYPEMVGKFAQLPTEFTADDESLFWHGEELDNVREETRKKLPFDADDLSYRGYQTSDGRCQALVYMVHSKIGEDRKHHPEICIRDVGGAKLIPDPDDGKGDKDQKGKKKGHEVALGGPKATDGPKAARFRYEIGGGRSMAVYYWHYTVSPTVEPWPPFQTVHQMFRPKPSVTIQLTVYGDNDRSRAEVEKKLIPQLHAALSTKVFPPNTPAGCDRLPVALLR